MARTFTLAAPANIASGRQAHHVVCADPAEYLDFITSRPHKSLGGDMEWHGGMDRAQALAALRHGNTACAEASDAMLSRLESMVDMSTGKHAIRLDVAGGNPCVPAHLAGAPMAMRRRVRIQDEAAPLGVVVDVVCSDGIDAAQMMKRGAAIVALVRLLAARRPVECWAMAGTGADNDSNGAFQWVRIDTAPLDLARAAFILGHISFARRLTYDTAAGVYNFQGGWPFRAGRLEGDRLAAIVAQAHPHFGESLLIPAAHLDDKAISDPEAWLRQHLARYAPDAE